MVEMAYLLSDGLPWHQLGQPIEDADAENVQVWADSTGISKWQYDSAPVLFFDKETGEVKSVPGKVVAFRTDSKEPMEVVGSGYNFHQPMQVMDFFDRIIKGMGYRMTTAGVLFGGKQFWAQATTGQSRKIGGVDRINDSVLIASGFDGASLGLRDVNRVVCDNTFRQAKRGTNNGKATMSHRGAFDPDEMISALGLIESQFEEYADLAERMSQVTISQSEAIDYFSHSFEFYSQEDEAEPIQVRLEIAMQSKNVMSCYDLFTGRAKGAELVTAKGTVWGAFNCVTEFVDHHRATQTWDARFSAAHFGGFAKVKENAWDQAMMIAA
jgi:phage/plasmid-like protein (TIGR03299 family)